MKCTGATGLDEVIKALCRKKISADPALRKSAPSIPATAMGSLSVLTWNRIGMSKNITSVEAAVVNQSLVMPVIDMAS